MNRIKNSGECCKSELDLFYTVPTNTSIQSSAYTTVSSNPLMGHEENFQININESEEYTDLSDIYLKLEVEIKKTNTNFDEENFKIGPINNFAHSLFKKIELSIGSGLNRKLVEVGSSHYGYKAYLLNLLNYGTDAKEGWMQSGLFIMDETGQFNNIAMESFEEQKVNNTNDTPEVVEIKIPKVANKGFLDRRKNFIDGKGKMKLIIPLHCDMLHSDKFLINNMGLFFEFERNKDSFLLMGDDKEFKVLIKKADMMVRKCQINESVKLAHRKALEIADIKYPIRQNKTYVSIIDNGTKEHTVTSLGTHIPNKIICGLVSDDAYNGTFESNPFEFESHNLQSISLMVNDSTKTIKLNEHTNDYSEGYHSLCESLNNYGSASSILKKSDYFKGNCFFCFNLSPDKGCPEQFNSIRTGSIQMVLNFKENLTKKLRLISIMEYDNQININKKMEVNFDYDL